MLPLIHQQSIAASVFSKFGIYRIFTGFISACNIHSDGDIFLMLSKLSDVSILDIDSIGVIHVGGNDRHTGFS